MLLNFLRLADKCAAYVTVQEVIGELEIFQQRKLAILFLAGKEGGFFAIIKNPFEEQQSHVFSS
jgi:hypothetical protein